VIEALTTVAQQTNKLFISEQEMTDELDLYTVNDNYHSTLKTEANSEVEVENNTDTVSYKSLDNQSISNTQYLYRQLSASPNDVHEGGNIEEKESPVDWLEKVKRIQSLLPNEFEQVLREYSVEKGRMFQFRHGPVIPTWMPITKNYLTRIRVPDPSQENKIKVCKAVVGQIGIVALDVSVSGGNWYWECSLQRKYVLKRIALGWMIKGSYAPLETDQFIFQGFGCGNSSLYPVNVHQIPVDPEERPDDNFVLGFLLLDSKVQFFCDGVLFTEDTVLPHTELYPFISSAEAAVEFSTSLSHMSKHIQINIDFSSVQTIAFPIREECLVENFKRAIAKELIIKEVPAFEEQEKCLTSYEQIFEACYSIETREKIQMLHREIFTPPSVPDVEVFLLLFHSVCQRIFGNEDCLTSSPTLPHSESAIFLVEDILKRTGQNTSQIDTGRFLDTVLEQITLYDNTESIPFHIRYVCALRMSESSRSSAIIRFERLQDVFEHFCQLASSTVSIIASEMELKRNQKTIKELLHIGGVAGGEKFIHE
jgi:hypothetical protein